MSPYAISPYPVDLGSLGQIEGLTISSSKSSSTLCHYIGGIPYALPPTGPFRFRRPRPLPPQYKYGTKSNPGRYTGGTGVCPQPGFRAPPDMSSWDEDCLQLNIWLPAGSAPQDGWPCYFYIHGGWLQFGTANTPDVALATLLSETDFKCMIIMPAYRLNAFGFIASRELEVEAEKNGETVGNMGFWDQRTALEWTSRYIHLFGGNSNNITVGGYSAGSHSTFQQLAHDISLPEGSSIIKRAIMWSNGPGVQPKALPETQHQFDELLTALDIPLSISASEKLACLRVTSAEKIIKVQDQMKLSEFRALSDGAFVDKTLIEKINDGTFARRIQKRGIKIMNGECRDEHYMYGSWRTPNDSYDAVVQRLKADYPEEAVSKIMNHYCADGQLPSHFQDWPDAFGRIYANIQVHALERGFAHKLAKSGLVVGKDILRYRIDWRAKCVDAAFTPEWKVTHATDMAIWFYGNGWGEGLAAKEKSIVQPIISSFAKFVKGEALQWGQLGPRTMLRLNADGIVDLWEDERWEEGPELWAIVNQPATKAQISKM